MKQDARLRCTPNTRFPMVGKRVGGLLVARMVAPLMLSAAVPDWESQWINERNREPARAYFMPEANVGTTRRLSLNGDWRFHWVPTPSQRPLGFEVPTFND